MRGRKPAAKRKSDIPVTSDALPRCPSHLTSVARKEWRRLAKPLHDMGILFTTDRAALAAYCQAWARWVEAEGHLQKGPSLIKMPSGYVQQSPWMSIANKQLDVMGRFMAELGLSPSARSRLSLPGAAGGDNVTTIEFVTVYTDKDGETVREPMRKPNETNLTKDQPKTITYEFNGNV